MKLEHIIEAMRRALCEVRPDRPPAQNAADAARYVHQARSGNLCVAELHALARGGIHETEPPAPRVEDLTALDTSELHTRIVRAR